MEQHVTAYRTARALGSEVAIYEAAGNPSHALYEPAGTTVQLLAAEKRGEGHAIGVRSMVDAGLKGERNPLEDVDLTAPRSVPPVTLLTTLPVLREIEKS